MRYRIVESPLGNCRIQVGGKLPFTWVFLKRPEGDNRWLVWTGTYAEAFERCQKLEMEAKNSKMKYYYPPLTPPLPKAPIRTDLPKTEPLPPYHPGLGAILLNERL